MASFNSHPELALPSADDGLAPQVEVVFKDSVSRLSKEERAAKRRRIEEHIRKYLIDEEPIHIQTAALRGPFDTWTNPWRSRGTRINDDPPRPRPALLLENNFKAKQKQIARIKTKPNRTKSEATTVPTRKQPARNKTKAHLQFKEIQRPARKCQHNRLHKDSPLESILSASGPRQQASHRQKSCTVGKWLKRIDNNNLDDPNTEQLPDSTPSRNATTRINSFKHPLTRQRSVSIVSASHLMLVRAVSPQHSSRTLSPIEHVPIDDLEDNHQEPEVLHNELQNKSPIEQQVLVPDSARLRINTSQLSEVQEHVKAGMNIAQRFMKRKAKYMNFKSPTPVKKIRTRLNPQSRNEAEPQILVQASFLEAAQDPDTDLHHDKIQETPVAYPQHTINSVPPPPTVAQSNMPETINPSSMQYVSDSVRATAALRAPLVASMSEQEEFATAPQVPIEAIDVQQHEPKLMLPPVMEAESQLSILKPGLPAESAQQAITTSRTVLVPSFPEHQDSKAYSPLTLDLNTQAAMEQAQTDFTAEFVSPAISPVRERRTSFFPSLSKIRSPEQPRRTHNVASTQDLMAAAQHLTFGTAQKSQPKKRASFAEWTISKPFSVSDENKDPSTDDQPSGSPPKLADKPVSASQPILKKRASLRQINSFSQSNSQPSPSTASAYPVTSFIPPATYSTAPESGAFALPESYEEGQRMFPSAEDEAEDDFNLDVALDDLTEFLAVDL